MTDDEIIEQIENYDEPLICGLATNMIGYYILNGRDADNDKGRSQGTT